MKRIHAVLLAALLACSRVEPPSSPSPPPRALAQSWVDAQYAQGIAIGLAQDGRAETYGVGRRDDVTTAAPDGDTVFEIGSITKVFTSLLLAEAVTRGEVTLDQPIQELVPPGIKVPTRDGQAITLRHLATHSSGLPRLPKSLEDKPYSDPYAAYESRELFADLQASSLAAKPGTTYDYSNFGAGLLGELLAQRAHMSFGDLIAARIAKPLGMTRTTVTDPSSNFAQGHLDDGVPMHPWHSKAMAGAGVVRSSVNDLLRLARAMMEQPPRDALRLTTATQADLATPSGGRRQKMGLGWHVGGPSMVWHNGATAGCHSFMAIDLANKKAVVVLANTSSDEIDDLGDGLVQLLRREEPKRPHAPVVTVPPERLRSYEGAYRLSDTFAITVTNEGGRTYAQATNQPRFRLYPTSPSHFELHGVAASIDFTNDGLVLHQDGDQTARKVK